MEDKFSNKSNSGNYDFMKKNFYNSNAFKLADFSNIQLSHEIELLNPNNSYMHEPFKPNTFQPPICTKCLGHHDRKYCDEFKGIDIDDPQYFEKTVAIMNREEEKKKIDDYVNSVKSSVRYQMKLISAETADINTLAYYVIKSKNKPIEILQPFINIGYNRFGRTKFKIELEKINL